jgi:hypothetical protein
MIIRRPSSDIIQFFTFYFIFMEAQDILSQVVEDIKKFKDENPN